MLPASVGCAVVPIGQGVLLAAERAAVSQAVLRRQAEFTSGRLALRRAINQTGFFLPDDRPILPRADRRPDLPSGLSTSLAHAGGLCIAIATRMSGVELGVDIEPVDAIRPDGLAETIGPFRMRSGNDDALAAFCAKESLFKRQYPTTRRMLDFADIAVVIARDDRFAACVSGVGLMRGRLCRIGGFYLAITFGPVSV